MKSMEYIAQYEPDNLQNIWSEEDKCLFQSAFAHYGKNFHKIQSWLPDKTINDLVEFYYDLKARLELTSPKEDSNGLDKTGKIYNLV